MGRESRWITKSSIRLQSELLGAADRASLSRTIADFEILRAFAALAISAKSGSGSLTVSVFTGTA